MGLCVMDHTANNESKPTSQDLTSSQPPSSNHHGVSSSRLQRPRAISAALPSFSNSQQFVMTPLSQHQQQQAQHYHQHQAHHQQPHVAVMATHPSHVPMVMMPSAADGGNMAQATFPAVNFMMPQHQGSSYVMPQMMYMAGSHANMAAPVPSQFPSNMFWYAGQQHQQQLPQVHHQHMPSNSHIQAQALPQDVNALSAAVTLAALGVGSQLQSSLPQGAVQGMQQHGIPSSSSADTGRRADSNQMSSAHGVKARHRSTGSASPSSFTASGNSSGDSSLSERQRERNRLKSLRYRRRKREQLEALKTDAKSAFSRCRSLRDQLDETLQGCGEDSQKVDTAKQLLAAVTKALPDTFPVPYRPPNEPVEFEVPKNLSREERLELQREKNRINSKKYRLEKTKELKAWEDAKDKWTEMQHNLVKALDSIKGAPSSS